MLKNPQCLLLHFFSFSEEFLAPVSFLCGANHLTQICKRPRRELHLIFNQRMFILRWFILLFLLFHLFYNPSSGRKVISFRFNYNLISKENTVVFSVACFFFFFTHCFDHVMTCPWDLDSTRVPAKVAHSLSWACLTKCTTAPCFPPGAWGGSHLFMESTHSISLKPVWSQPQGYGHIIHLEVHCLLHPFPGVFQ